MLSNAELLVIYIILTLNLLVLTFIKARTTIVITIILSQLATILFYNMVISDSQILKELVIVTIIYSAIILTLISNSNNIYNITPKNKLKVTKILTLFPVAIIFTLIVTSGVFYLVKNINQTSNIVREKQIVRENEINKNPLIFPGHPAHINVKKYYFGKNIDNRFFSKNSNGTEEIEELHNEQDKKVLKNNILFKKSSNAIIIIISFMTILLLNLQLNIKKFNKGYK